MMRTTILMQHNPARRVLAALLVLTLLLPTLALAPPAQAATCQVTNGNNSGDGSLRAALARSGNFAGQGCETITFAFGIYDIQVTSFLTINRPVTIQGAGIDLTSIRHTGAGAFTGSVLFITDGGAATLSDLAIADGDVTSGPQGGGIYAAALSGKPQVSLALDHVRVSGNRTTGSGGGIHATNAVVTIANSVIEDNQATNDGGGLYLSDRLGSASATLTNTIVTGNKATGMDGRNPIGQGGGIAAVDANTGDAQTVSLTVAGGSTIGTFAAPNSSTSHGGGIYGAGAGVGGAG
jgi:predicted outer membrane repeat protein